MIQPQFDTIRSAIPWRTLRKRWPLVAALGVVLVVVAWTWRLGAGLGYLREQASPFEVFTLVLFLMLLLPRVLERLHLPGLVGLLLSGVLVGPHVLDILDPNVGMVNLFASVGRIFLMFLAGLEIDMAIFQATQSRSIGFGGFTFLFPFLAGAAVSWWYDFPLVASLLVGSLLASHTLLGFPVVVRLGLAKAEPMAVTVGATVFTDIASLLVLAVCIAVFKGGFSPWGLALQLGELLVYGIIVLQGLPLLGRRYFRRHRDNEEIQFAFTFLVVMLAAVGAHVIHLEDIVGGFLAGLAVNRLLTGKPVREKLILMGSGLFVPLFFVTIGVKLDLPVFVSTLGHSLGFVVAILGALLAGKFIAALVAQRLYGYSTDEGLTMWALTLPQVAATLAAAMAAYETLNADGDRLITESVLNAVIVLMVVTAVAGPVLTERFGRRLQAIKPAVPSPATSGEPP